MRKYKYLVILFLLLLVACSAEKPQTNESLQTTQPTDTDIATRMNLTSAVSPTTMLITANSLTVTPILHTPSPQSTIPIFITPDVEHIARWKEYEYALGKALLSLELLRGAVLCEWEILGQSNSEIYVWVACTGTVPVGIQGIFPSAESPAVIFQETAGEIKKVEVPGSGTHYAYDIRKMFPVYVQEIIFNNLIDYESLWEHLRWRQEHLGELPLIVLNATLIP